MGSTRTNVHWWYSQEGSRFYGYRITRGANAWEDASGLDAGFTEVSTKSDAEIRDGTEERCCSVTFQRR